MCVLCVLCVTDISCSRAPCVKQKTLGAIQVPEGWFCKPRTTIVRTPFCISSKVPEIFTYSKGQDRQYVTREAKQMTRIGAGGWEFGGWGDSHGCARMMHILRAMCLYDLPQMHMRVPSMLVSVVPNSFCVCMLKSTLLHENFVEGVDNCLYALYKLIYGYRNRGIIQWRSTNPNSIIIIKWLVSRWKTKSRIE
jgi:hypothetical protein